MTIPFSTEPVGTLFIEVYDWNQKIIHSERLEPIDDSKWVTVERMEAYSNYYRELVNDDFDFIKFMGVTYDVNSCDLILDIIARYQNTTGFNYLKPTLDVSFHYCKYLREYHKASLKTSFMFRKT